MDILKKLGWVTLASWSLANNSCSSILHSVTSGSSCLTCRNTESCSNPAAIQWRHKRRSVHTGSKSPFSYGLMLVIVTAVLRSLWYLYLARWMRVTDSYRDDVSSRAHVIMRREWLYSCSAISRATAVPTNLYSPMSYNTDANDIPFVNNFRTYRFVRVSCKIRYALHSDAVTSLLDLYDAGDYHCCISLVPNFVDFSLFFCHRLTA